MSIPDDINEDGIAANAMGASSSVAGSGGIDTFDPILSRKKTILDRLLKNNVNQIGNKKLPRKLKDVLGADNKNDKIGDSK